MKPWHVLAFAAGYLYVALFGYWQGFLAALATACVIFVVTFVREVRRP